MKIKVAARASLLSRAQVNEVALELSRGGALIEFAPTWVTTHGDLDLSTSLRDREGSDFFTREVDALVLNQMVDVAIHSAKDMGEMPKGLACFALTLGVDPRDLLVTLQREPMERLPSGARIATSSLRREEVIRSLRSDWKVVDIRGDIPTRLAKLTSRQVEGIVIAKAAMIRLHLLDSFHWIHLPGSVHPLQGRLAIVGREGDVLSRSLFAPLDFKEGH